MAERETTKTVRARIGYLSPSLPSASHVKKLQLFIPKDVEIIFEQLTLHDGRLSDVQGKLDMIVGKAVELTDKHHWDGLIFPGAPREVLNPGLYARFSSSLTIPVATALRSSVAAMQAFSVKRVLLMTPFEESLNKLIREFLADAGIEAVSPAKTLQHYTDALKLTSDDVESLTKKALAQHERVEAVYFQGAVLDPIEILQKMEGELEIPVLASNPAMLWFMLSKLGVRYEIAGYGKLLSSWPALPLG